VNATARPTQISLRHRSLGGSRRRGPPSSWHRCIPAGGPGRRLPRVYRAVVLLDENHTLFTLQALTKASDAHDVRVESTKLKDYDIES